MLRGCKVEVEGVLMYTYLHNAWYISYDLNKINECIVRQMPVELGGLNTGFFISVAGGPRTFDFKSNLLIL